MSMKFIFALLATLLFMQPVFADNEMGMRDKQCSAIVKACLDAGFKGHGSESKQFWKDCMQPLLIGKKVSGVTVSAEDVKMCRQAKIKQLEHELNVLKAVQ